MLQAEPHTIKRQAMNYTMILDQIMEKWLGPDFANSNEGHSTPYRMLALLLDDPWTEPADERKFPQLRDYNRNYIVDITNPEIRRKLDMLNGPYFNTIMKMLELRMYDENSTRTLKQDTNSSHTLV